MEITERMISIKLFSINKKNDAQKIINSLNYPVKTDFYEYGIYETSQVDNRTIYSFLCQYKTEIKVPIFKNSKLKFDLKEVERFSFAKFSIKELKENTIIELINSDQLTKTVLLNEFGKGQIEKFGIDENKYSKLYDDCIIKTAGSYVINALSKKFNINIRSDELGDNEVKVLFDKGQIKNTSFNGKILLNKELSIKVSKDGNLLIYNNSKNPLEWEEVFRLLDEYVY
ncbi:MAG: hypothetical protein LUQ66_08215 [Methanoregula sp.]|nr:hypothetical protein [Methanoregula sp.]